MTVLNYFVNVFVILPVIQSTSNPVHQNWSRNFVGVTLEDIFKLFYQQTLLLKDNGKSFSDKYKQANKWQGKQNSKLICDFFKRDNTVYRDKLCEDLKT